MGTFPLNFLQVLPPVVQVHLFFLTCYHSPQIRALMGQKKVKGLLRNTAIQREGNTVGFLIPGAFSKVRLTYPHQLFQTSILTCLLSCPKVQQCYIPIQIISLPPKTSYHLCFPPSHSLSLSRCLYFPPFNKSDLDKKPECLQYFSSTG